MSDQQLRSSDKADALPVNPFFTLEPFFERQYTDRRLLNEVCDELGITILDIGDSFVIDGEHSETVANLISQLWQQ